MNTVSARGQRKPTLKGGISIAAALLMLLLVTSVALAAISTSFEGGWPTGWTNNSAYVNTGSAHTGTWKAGMNAIGDWIRTPQETNPAVLTFWARTSGATSNWTVEVQTSPDGTSWTTQASYVANGSDTGNITLIYSQKTVNLNLTGDYYVQWIMTARSGGSFYLDDVELTNAPSSAVSISKVVTPTNVDYHGTITYTVVISNSTAVSDTNALFTDTLPISTTFGSWIEQPTGASESGDEITWNNTLTNNTAITLSFTAVHTGTYGDVITNTAEYSGSVVISDTAAFFVRVMIPDGLVINEFDGQTPGTDVDEFIELYDGGVGNTALDGLVVVLYNGSDDQSYTPVFDLDGYTTDPDGYFVIGGTGLSQTNDITVTSSSWLQNGADAVALFVGDASDFPNDTALTNVNLIDAVVYDDWDSDDAVLRATLLNPGQPVVLEGSSYAEAEANSGQRCLNGSGGQRNTDTYAANSPTPGAANYCPPNVTVAKTGSTTAPPGSLVQYTIDYANVGTDNAYSIVISDTLPDELSYVSDDSGLSCNACSVGATGSFTWSVGTLSPGDSKSFVLTTMVTDSAHIGSVVTNTVKVTTPSTETTTADNSDQWETTISSLDLVVSKTGPQDILIGDDIVYTIILEARGITTATNVVLTDTLPISTTYVSDDSGVAPTEPVSGTYVWSLGNVLTSTPRTLVITVSTGGGQLMNKTLLTNTVQVSTDVVGDNSANNTDEWETTAYPLTSIYDIQYVPDPSTDDASPYENQQVWTEGIVVANYGDQVFIQDGPGAWNGVMLYRPNGTLNVGDYVQVNGTVIEYYGMTEFAYGADTTVISTGNALPAPAPVTAADILYNDADTSEGYEGVFVETRDITVTATESYGIWAFTDASGGTGKADDWAYTPDPAVGDFFALLRGPLAYDYSQYKVLPRDADDALEGDIIVIEKSAPATVALGGTFTYTLTIENRKGFALSDVVISDTIPANTSFFYALDGGAEANGVVSWTVATLAHLDEISVRFVVTAANSSAVIVNDDYAVSASNHVTPTFGDAVNTAIGELRIYHLQGDGDTSPYLGQQATVQGVVVADFQAGDEMDGFFMQDAAGDGNALTSDGIFVYDPSGDAVDLGDWVQVSGTVDEYYNLTQLDTVSAISVISSGNTIAPTSVTLPEQTNGDLERYEGMLVTIPHTMTVEQNYFQGRYGQVTLASGGRLYQPTNVYAPGSAEAIALADENARRLLILDDGSSDENPGPIPYIGADDTLRAGDVVSAGLTGVLGYGRINSSYPAANDYRLHPTAAVSITRVNARTAASDDVGGRLQVASFNVLNYFNGDGLGGGFPTSRGADTPEEFTRQRTKIISAVLAIDADVVGLMEIENDGYGATSAISDLVGGLNAVAGAGTYAFIDPGVSQIGTDEIAVGLLYRPGAVTPVGSAAILDSTFDPAFIDTKNRPALAQTFAENATGARFTAVVNHLKSKGSPCDDVGDPDTGDGQGNCNLTRTDAMTVEVAWLATDPTGSGDPDFLIIGDLNSYAMEDPITAAKDAGYTDLLQNFVGLGAYSYIFDGQSGYLDYALANGSLNSQVTGVTDWHINADEPSVIDYNTEYKPQDLYSPTVYRASDHDPIIVGLDLIDQTGLTITKSVMPTTDVALDSVVTYTVTIANNGDADATGVVITDEIPSEVTFGGYVLNPGGTAQLPDPTDVIVWEYPVASGDSYTFVFTATVTAGTLYYEADVTNVAYFTSDNGGSGSDAAIFTIEEGIHYIYLPLVMRNH